MKSFAVLAALLGMTIFGLLLVQTGLVDVTDAIASVGWGTAIVVLTRFGTIALAGFGWYLLFPAGQVVPLRVAMLVRFIREGVNNLLPVGQVGGDLIGARLITFWKVDGATAGAVSIADVAIQAATQAVFAVIGIVLLVILKGDSDIVRYAIVGVIVAMVLLGLFFVLQARLGGRWIVGVVRRIGRGRDWFAVGLVERLGQRLGLIYSSPGRLAASTITHLCGWFVGSAEVYVALNFMGFDISIADAIVIESLGQAVRGAAFAIPGGIGVQEGGYVALCGLFGVPPGPALALSLVKRVADLVLGLPFLLAWQALEGRRLFRPEIGPAKAPFAEGRG